MTTFGELRIVPSANLGRVGPNEGKASLYQWRWYHSAQGALPWLVLIVAMVGFKANHAYRTLYVLVPLAIVNLLYLSVKKISGMTSSSAVQFDVMFQSLATGLTLLWLMTPVLKGHGLVRVAIAFGSVMTVTGLCIFSYGTASSQETIILLVFLGTMGVVLVLAPIASGRFCGGLYRPLHLTLWLGAWTVLGGVTAVLGTLAILLAVLPSGPSASQILATILMAMLLGAAMGLGMYVLYLPYMILGFLSPFFRNRLQVCLNLRASDDGTPIP